MGAKTEINWCDATWNPVIGCTKVSSGCANCYAEKVAKRFGTAGEYYNNVVKDDGYGTPTGWNGLTVRKQPKFNPLTARKPRTIFVCSMGDLFHERVLDDWIDEVMETIKAASWHRYMILTKRPKQMLSYMRIFPWGKPPSNLALGVSIEDQATADKRIPLLLQTPAAKRFVSFEPALGPVNLCTSGGLWSDMNNQPVKNGHSIGHGIDLVIMGGESGPKARPMHPDWARSMRDQCASAGVPFHFKQWGEWAPNCLCDTREAHKTIKRPQPGKPGVMFRCGKKTPDESLTVSSITDQSSGRTEP